MSNEALAFQGAPVSYRILGIAPDPASAPAPARQGAGASDRSMVPLDHWHLPFFPSFSSFYPAAIRSSRRAKQEGAAPRHEDGIFSDLQETYAEEENYSSKNSVRTTFFACIQLRENERSDKLP